LIENGSFFYSPFALQLRGHNIQLQYNIIIMSKKLMYNIKFPRAAATNSEGRLLRIREKYKYNTMSCFLVIIIIIKKLKEQRGVLQ
jgi:hypothetical protein